MISSSSPRTTYQLRRAKSTSTAHSHRSQSSLPGFIDGTAIKDQALIAAMTAFEQANGKENSKASVDRKTPQRRRSQKGKQMEGEGSHFQANRLQRSQSVKRLSADSTEVSPGRVRRFTATSMSSASTTEYRRPQHEKQTTSDKKHDTFSFRKIRKARSLYSPGDQQQMPPPNDGSMIGEQSMDLAAHVQEHSLQSILETEPPTELIDSSLPFSRNTNFEVDVNVLKARDEHLNQFHKHSIRNRPSFLFTPFRKRPDRSEAQHTSSSDNGVTYDHIVSSPLPAIQAPQRKGSQEKRSLSLSIKEKIRRVFRKPTLPQNLPVQHVAAKRNHFGDHFTEICNAQTDPDLTVEHQSADKSTEIQSSQIVGPFVPPHMSTRPASPATSEATIGTSKSRVTSWTNSTITAPAASRCSNRLDRIMENGTEDVNAGRKESGGTSREHSIFRRIMRRSSAIEVNPKDTGKRECIRNSAHTEWDSSTRLASSGTATSGSSLDTLPSQRRRSSLLSAKPSQLFRSTVRAVTPDNRIFRTSKAQSVAPAPTYRLTPTPSKLDLPVTPIKGSECGDANAADQNSLPRTRNRLQKVQPKTMKPTADQIAFRVERSNDRWKSPLEEGSRSLFYPRSPQGQDKIRPVVSTAADNWPLRSEKMVETAASDNFNQVKRRENISPSLYSRGTDSESIPPISAIAFNANGSNVSIGSSRSNDTGTAIISASTPVASYTLGSSPSDDEQPCRQQRSADWRAWLSKEVEDLGTPPPDDFTLNSNITIRRKPRTGHRREDAQILEAEHAPGSTDGKAVRSRTSSRISDEDRPLSRLREEHRQASRSSSRMNDRFPMIERGRPSSRNQRKTTPPSNITPASTNSSQRLSSKGKEKALDTPTSTDQPAKASGLENLPPGATKVYSNSQQSLPIISPNSTPIAAPDGFAAQSSSPPTPRHQLLNTYKSSPLLQVRPSSALEMITPPNTLHRQPLTSTPTSGNRGTYSHSHTPTIPSSLRHAQSTHDV